MTTEITTKTDTSEIQGTEAAESYADAVVAEKKAEREEALKAADARVEQDEQRDGHLTDAHATNENTGASDDVDDGKQETQDTGSDTSGPEWLDDDLRAKLSAYGLDEASAADFGSREELERSLRLIDAAAVKASQNNADEKSGDDDDSQETDEGTPPEFKRLSTDDWDDELANTINGLHDLFESRFRMLELRMGERTFDAAIDSLQVSQVFGKTGSETPEQLNARQQVMTEVHKKMQELGPEGQLQQAHWVGVFARGLFPDAFDKKTIKAATQRVKRQSQQRQGDAAEKPGTPRESPRERAARLFREKSS